MSEQNYELRTDYWCHVEVCRELGLGAELYDSQDTITVKHGSRVIWWWKPDRQHQQIKQETEALAELFGAISQKPEEFTPDKTSPERLVKAFIRHVLKLPRTKQTNWYGKRYYYLARTRPHLVETDQLTEVQKLDTEHGFNYELLGNDSHCHYLYLASQPQGGAIELDIKSAYFTTFLEQRTMLLNDPGESGKPYFISDGEAIKQLHYINPQLPQWFRFRMLEIISSHELKYCEFDPATGSSQTKVNPNVIYCGMAFNAAHKAMYTVYQTMATVANLV